VAEVEVVALALRINRRSFDGTSRDEAARGSAQDDNFFNSSLKLQVDTTMLPVYRRLASPPRGVPVRPPSTKSSTP
jgi:hypothetical protein